MSYRQPIVSHDPALCCEATFHTGRFTIRVGIFPDAIQYASFKCQQPQCCNGLFRFVSMQGDRCKTPGIF